MVTGEKWTKGDFPKARCECCGEIVDSRIIERHHIIPINEGGSDAPSNVQALCPNCHRFLHIVEEGISPERARERLVEKPIRETLKEILIGEDRKPDECPYCWEEGVRVKGRRTGEVTEFKDSIAYTYECPRKEHKFVHFIKPKPRRRWQA